MAETERPLEIAKKADSGVTAKIDKQTLRDFYHLFTHTPDTILKPFWKRIVVTKTNIKELLDNLGSKLRSHHVIDPTISVVVTFSRNKSVTLGSYERFMSHNFDEPSPIEAMTISANFLFSEEPDELPDRYQFVIKISNGPSSLHFMQSLFSNDHERVESAMEGMAPCIAKIDYINEPLSDGLIEVIQRWVDGLNEPVITSALLETLTNNKGVILPAVHYCIPFFSIVVAAAILHNLGVSVTLDSFGYWLLATFSVIYIGNAVGRRFSERIESRIKSLMKVPIFRISKGDQTVSDDLEKQTQRAKNSVIKAILFNMVFGISASLVAAFLYDVIKIQ